MNEHITKTNDRETEFRFSGVHVSDKCEAVFSSNVLLKEHDKNSHMDNLDIETDIQELNATPVKNHSKFIVHLMKTQNVISNVKQKKS